MTVPADDIRRDLSSPVASAGQRPRTDAVRAFTLPTLYGSSIFPIGHEDMLAAFTPDSISLADCKRMRRDPQLKFGLRLIKAPLMNPTRFHLSGPDAAVNAFVDAVLRPLLSRLIRFALNALDFGFSACEKTWELRDVVATVRTGAGEAERVFSSAYVLSGIRDLDPSHTEVLIDERSGAYAGVKYGDVSLRPGQTFFVTYNGDFGNPYGESLLHAAYVPWRYSGILRKLWGRFLERFAMGTWVGYVPAEVDRVDREGNRQDPVRWMNAQLTNLRGASGLSLPSEFDPASNERLWDIKMLESSREGRAFEAAVYFNEVQKLRAILVPERVATQDTLTGSHSMAESHAEVFFLMLDEIVDNVLLEPIQQQVIEPLVRLNFGESARVPVLRATRLSREQRQNLMKLVERALDSPITLQDGRQLSFAALLDHTGVLEQLNIPHRTVEEAAMEPLFPVPGSSFEEPEDSEIETPGRDDDA